MAPGGTIGRAGSQLGAAVAHTWIFSSRLVLLALDIESIFSRKALHSSSSSLLLAGRLRLPG